MVRLLVAFLLLTLWSVLLMVPGWQNPGALLVADSPHALTQIAPWFDEPLVERGFPEAFGAAAMAQQLLHLWQQVFTNPLQAYNGMLLSCFVLGLLGFWCFLSSVLLGVRGRRDRLVPDGSPLQLKAVGLWGMALVYATVLSVYLLRHSQLAPQGLLWPLPVGLWLGGFVAWAHFGGGKALGFGVLGTLWMVAWYPHWSPQVLLVNSGIAVLLASWFGFRRSWLLPAFYAALLVALAVPAAGAWWWTGSGTPHWLLEAGTAPHSGGLVQLLSEGWLLSVLGIGGQLPQLGAGALGGWLLVLLALGVFWGRRRFLLHFMGWVKPAALLSLLIATAAVLAGLELLPVGPWEAWLAEGKGLVLYLGWLLVVWVGGRVVAEYGRQYRGLTLMVALVPLFWALGLSSGELQVLTVVVDSFADAYVFTFVAGVLVTAYALSSLTQGQALAGDLWRGRRLPTLGVLALAFMAILEATPRTAEFWSVHNATSLLPSERERYFFAGLDNQAVATVPGPMSDGFGGVRLYFSGLAGVQLVRDAYLWNRHQYSRQEHQLKPIWQQLRQRKIRYLVLHQDHRESRPYLGASGRQEAVVFNNYRLQVIDLSRLRLADSQNLYPLRLQPLER